MIINPSTLTSGIKVIPSDSINIPGPQLKFSGVTTADLASKLQDTSAPLRGGFQQTLEASPNSNQVETQGIQTGDVVYNTSVLRPGVAIVTAIDSNNTLSLSADIFVNATTTRDGYAIYEGNGINVNAAWGWQLKNPQAIGITTNNTAAFNNSAGVTVAYDVATSTYIGDATFQLVVVGNIVTSITTTATGTLQEVDPVGKTVNFTAAAINAAIGAGTGVGNVTATITAADFTYIAPPAELGPSNSYQLYVGGAGGDLYVTTNMGDELFIESVPVGTVLPVVVVRVNVGAAAAAGNGNTNTLTTATEIVALT